MFPCIFHGKYWCVFCVGVPCPCLERRICRLLFRPSKGFKCIKHDPGEVCWRLGGVHLSVSLFFPVELNHIFTWNVSFVNTVHYKCPHIVTNSRKHDKHFLTFLSTSSHVFETFLIQNLLTHRYIQLVRTTVSYTDAEGSTVTPELRCRSG